MKFKKIMPLNDSQMGIYLECADSSALQYNITFEYEFGAGVEAEKLKEACDAVLANYAAFSSRLEIVDGQPMLALPEGETVKTGFRELREEEYQKVKAGYTRPFRFGEEGLCRAEVFKTEKSVYLLLDVHHLIYDGISTNIFETALQKAYSGEKLQEEEISIFEASGQNEEPEKVREAVEYFEEKLSGKETDSNLIPDLDTGDTARCGILRFSPETDTKAVAELSGRLGVSENVVLLSAFAYALAKYSGSREALFASIDSGRRGKQLGNTMGFFVRTFPLYFEIDENSPIEEYILRIKEEYFGAMKHDCAPFAELAEKLGVRSDIKYVYQGEMLNDFLFNGETAKKTLFTCDDALSNLDVMIERSGGKYQLRADYRKGLYSEGNVLSFLKLFSKILKGLTEKERLYEIELTSEEDIAALNAINSTERSWDRNRTVWGALRKVIEKKGDSPAVCFKDRVITYNELDSLSAKLAAFISSEGLGEGDFIPVLTERNELMPVAAWGIVRAGAAYEPLDPAYPRERIAYMIKDCGAKLIIAQRELQELAEDFKGRILYADEIANLPEPESFEPLDKKNSALVIIYTSGTTGVPKGCVLENRNILCFFENHREVMQLDENTRAASYASFGFDAGVSDIFAILLAGGELHIIPDEIKLDIGAMNAFYREKGITFGFMTTQVASMFLRATDCKTLKSFNFGGERLVPFEPPKGIACVNGYGPSETIAYVCRHTLTDSSKIQPIGTPMGNTKLYVADSYLRLLPAGCCGELCIAGGQVGRGYLNQPEKTAEVFRKNPFSAERGYERIYRTGDLVRLLPSGEFDFVGRRDGQIKIRGFRVELTEIEQAIRSFPGIKNATVQAFDSPAGGKYISAYVVSEGKADFRKLSEFIGRSKPSYMIPAAFMQLEEIPLNANGKVDRKKLPLPELRSETGRKPENELQQKIYELAAGVIGSEAFGTDESLFSAGLSSIGVIKLNMLLAEEFGISMTIGELREKDTVLKLEEHILSAASEEKEAKRESYPLTKTQEGIYIECISHPEGTEYNIPLLLKIDNGLDGERLKQAIAEALRAHSYVNTRLFTDGEGKVCQTAENNPEFTAADIRELEAPHIESIVGDLIKPYKLLGDRLFRFAVIHADGLYLFADFHHIIADGTGIKILLEDIGRAYAGQKIEPESFSGFDVSAAEEKKRNGRELEKAKEFYKQLLEEADTDFLPGSDLLPETKRGSGSLKMLSEPERLLSAKAFCAENSLSMNALMLSVFGFVLARFNAEDYSVFTTVYNGRADSRCENTLAMLVKTLPVLVEAGEGKPVELAKKISSRMLDSMSSDIYSFGEISREFGVKSDVMFIWQGADFGFESFCGAPAEEIPLELKDKKAPFSLQVYERKESLEYITDYDNELYSEVFAESIVRAFDFALGEFLTRTELKDVELSDAKTLEQLEEYNRTECPFNEEQTICSMFEKTAAEQGENIAVVCKERQLSYSKLEALSAALASHLISKGVGPNEFVPVLVNRNEYMPIGALGIIRAGAAYEPLDPAYPEERIRFMIKDADAKIMLADRSLLPLVEGLDIEIICTDEIEKLPPVSNFVSAAKPEDSFVIIYTSGTTGVPKGNVLCHKNPVALFSYHIKDAELTPSSNTAYYTGFGFDAGMLDLYAPLLSGGRLCIVPEELRRDPNALDGFFCKNKITHSSMTTQMGSLFVQTTKCRTLKYFQVGGEKLIPFVPPAGLRFMNGYGPSECTIYSSRYEVKDEGRLQPIGKPIDNVKFYILDKNGHRLPFGAAGELCIAGKQVGQGYRNRKEKTEQVFTANPFCRDKGYERLYHTGDVVRQLPDGNYDFVGRKDGQVKIRGFRVELTEVEQIIRKFPGIENATVQAFDDPSGGKFIAAYVVSGEKLDFGALGEFIGQSKPSYMIPAGFMQLDSIPLTANGKIDKRALPIPERKPERTGAEPADETEEAFCDIFAQVLGLEKVYADDDFFAIGGSSITAAQAVVKCDAAGFNIVFKNFFENPTPQKLARFVTEAPSSDIYAPTGAEKEKYDYSCLAYNVPENLPKIRNNGVGDVLLTGATGFLGAHVYKTLIENTDGKVICLVRGKSGISPEDRLEMTLVYYFEDWLKDEYLERTIVVNGTLDDEDIDEKLQGIHFDTIINNAANVKHFAKGDDLINDNYRSVEHLIALAEIRKAKLIQASSLSVCGESVNGSIPMDFKFREFNLNIGQSLENKYVYSKYLAEQAIIDATSRGRIRGKIIRFGNLSARASDGEFQLNSSNSGLLKIMQGYIKLGCYPVDMMDAGIEFSPIDKVAEAMVLLAGTPDEFTVFHAKNCHEIHYAYFINALRARGHNISIVEREEFEERFRRALEEEEDVTAYTGFIAYLNRTDSSVTDTMVYNDDESNSKEAAEKTEYETRIRISSDTSYTTKALYRLGFAWPLTSAEYLENMVDMLDDKAFF